MHSVSAEPEQVALVVGELVVWLVDVKTERSGVVDELPLPSARSFASPAHYGVVDHRKSFVRAYKVFVDAEHFAESVACWTCAERVVEVEHLL